MGKTTSKKDNSKYAAFIRGINVGGNSMIKMEDLAKEFKKLGFLNVKTILASGNVVFESPEKDMDTISQTIANCLEKKLSRKISVIVRLVEELRDLESGNPFKGVKVTPGTRMFITFIPGYTKSMNTSKPVTHDDYTITKIIDGMIVSVLHEKPGVGTLDLMGGIEEKFGNKVTTRTWNTILKVLQAGDKK